MKIKQFGLMGLLLLPLSLVQAQQVAAQNKPAIEQQYQQLTWLTGTWNRVNTKPGRSGHERWEKAGHNALRGWGVSMREQDTAFVEKLQLVIKDSSIWYVADVAENKAPVWFKLTSITPDGFTCENPTHDFPQKITYQRDGDKLLATTSGNGRTIAFNFVRQTQ